MKLATYLKTAAFATAALFTLNAQAAKFIIPQHYELHLVDGFDTDLNVSGNTVTLDEGKHQIVVLFRDSFGTNQNERIIASGSPIVIEIEDLGADETFTFSYQRPYGIDQAVRYSQNQVITITDGDGKPLGEGRAKYFLLTSETGFSVLRNYRAELASIDRLYTRAPQKWNEGTVSVNEQGVTSISVNPGSALLSTSSTSSAVDPTGMKYYSTETSSAIPAGGSSRVKLNDLITMYNRADAKTKDQFIKYINSQ